jgi:hypothetical protein
MSSNKNPLVAMNLPTSVPEYIIKAKAIHDSMYNSPEFQESAPILVELNAGINVLEKAQFGLSQNPPTSTTESRDVAQNAVKKLLQTLAGNVQSVANKSAERAGEMILKSGFDIKKTGGNPGRKNTAVDGANEGIVLLSAATGGGHQWQQSLDGGLTFTALNPTANSSNTVYNLTPGQKVWFQNRTVLSGNNYGDWSEWISIVPKVYR